MNHLFTALAILWIIYLVVVFLESKNYKTCLTTANAFIGGGIMTLALHTFFTNLAIGNMAGVGQNGTFVLLMLPLLYLSFVKIPKQDSKKALIARNILAGFNGCIHFIHFIVFNIVLL